MSLDFKKHLFAKLGGLILALLPFTTQAFVSMTGQIDDFNLNLCGIKNCIRIESNQAFTSGISPGYALHEAVISIFDIKTKAVKKLLTEDVFFDSRTNKIFIRKIVSLKDAEAIYDLTAEQLSLYHKDQIL